MSNELRKGPSGPQAAITSDQVQNLSGVAGANVTEALNNAGGGGGTLVNLYNTVWVDKNTTVAIADQTGNIEAPFSTLAGARTALLALANDDPAMLYIMPGDYSAEAQFAWDSSAPGVGRLNIINGSFLPMQLNQSIGNVTLPEVNFASLIIVTGCIFTSIVGTAALYLTNCQQLTGNINAAKIICNNSYLFVAATLSDSGSQYINSTSGGISIGASEATITFEDTNVGGDISFAGDPGTAFMDDVSEYWMLTNGQTITNGSVEPLVPDTRLPTFLLAFAANDVTINEFLNPGPNNRLDTTNNADIVVYTLPPGYTSYTISMLAWTIKGANANGNKIATVQKGGVNQTLTAQINSGNTGTVNDTTHSFSAVPGDQISVVVTGATNQAGPLFQATMLVTCHP